MRIGAEIEFVENTVERVEKEEGGGGRVHLIYQENWILRPKQIYIKLKLNSQTHTHTERPCKSVFAHNAHVGILHTGRGRHRL